MDIEPSEPVQDFGSFAFLATPLYSLETDLRRDRVKCAVDEETAPKEESLVTLAFPLTLADKVV